MPKKYIPIPKDQQKKRGPKKDVIQDPEKKLFADPFNEIAPAPHAPEPTPTPEPVEAQKPIEAPEPVEAPKPIEAPEPTPAPGPSVISSDVPSDLDSIINDYSASGPAPQEQTSEDHIKALHGETPAQTTTAPKISLVRGYMILLVLDFVLPMGITFLLRKTNNPKFNKLKAKDIKLSDDEFDDLEPVADEVAKDIQLNLSPMTQLFLGMSIIYGGKILTLEK
jgi:hypothetical protein